MYHKHHLSMTRREFTMPGWHEHQKLLFVRGAQSKKAFECEDPVPSWTPTRSVSVAWRQEAFFTWSAPCQGKNPVAASARTPGALCKKFSRISDFWEWRVWNVSWTRGNKWCIWTEISRIKNKRKLLAWVYSKITKQSEKGVHSQKISWL